MKEFREQIKNLQKMASTLKGMEKTSNYLIKDSEDLINAEYPGILEELKKCAKSKDLKGIQKIFLEVKAKEEEKLKEQSNTSK